MRAFRHSRKKVGKTRERLLHDDSVQNGPNERVEPGPEHRRAGNLKFREKVLAACRAFPVPAVRIFAAVLALALLFYGRQVLLMLALIALGASSRLYARFVPVALGFELCTLSTVLAGKAMGPLAGMIVGLSSIILSVALTQENPKRLVASIPGFALIGLVSGIATGIDIKHLGMALVLAYNFFLNAVHLGLMKSSFLRCAVFSITNVIFNFFVFKYVAIPALAMII